MRVLHLALKDLLQIVRDRRSAIFLLAMPIVMTLFMGWMLGMGKETDPRLPVAVVDLDGGPAGTHFRALLNLSPVVRPDPSVADAAAARVAVRKGTLAGLVVIPAGTSEALAAGRTPRLTLVFDRESTAGHAAKGAVQAVTTRLLGAAEAARLAVEAVDEAGRPPEAVAAVNAPAGAREAAFYAAFDDAARRWGRTPWAVRAAPVGAAANAGEDFGFVRASPGMTVMFAIFGLMTSAMILVSERRSRALARLTALGAGRGELLFGHLVAMTVVVLVQVAVLMAFGQAALGVDYLRAPGAVAVVAVALALWVASLGLLIGALARSEEQVSVLSMVAMFFFAGIGGAMFPVETASGLFAAVGRATPAGLAMAGFNDVLLRGQGLAEVWPFAVGVLLWAAAFLFVAARRLKVT